MITFFTFFMVTTTISSIGILFIMLIKNALKKHISVRWQYNLGLLFFVLLATPFIPSGFYASLNMGRWFSALSFERETITSTVEIASEGTRGTYGINGFQDLAISIDRFVPENLLIVFMGIWLVGIIASAAITILCNHKLRLIKESVKPIECQEMISLFLSCKNEIGIKRNVLLGSSIMLKTPMTVGFFKPIIIMPARKMTLSDSRYVMLHEFVHCKNRDVQINTIMCMFQILYWFNPLVYFAFKQMRMDRELACDASVLEILPREFHINYGQTLLKFVKSLSPAYALSFAANMGDSKPHIIKRIIHIASYTTESGLLKAKSVCLFILMFLLIFTKIPVFSTLAANGNDRFIFEADNVLYIDLSDFFGDFEGSFVLYDLNASFFTIHNRDMSMTRMSPNSTYKIVSALIALDIGILETDNTEREWDGKIYPFEAWNQNQNLVSAMYNSVNWYFQDFDAQIGMEKLYSYLMQLSYGNRDLSGGIADFWMESSLRISPLEQVELLTGLYRNDTVFCVSHVNALKDVLRLTEINGTILSGKTGTGVINGSAVNGWFIGYVETSSNSFVFATYIQAEDNARGSMAAEIALSILESKEVF